MKAPLFLYGTLLDPRVLAARGGDAGLPRRTVPARLDGFARVVFRGTPYPTLVRRPGASVAGLLLRPTPAALAALRRYEGPCYRLVPVRARTTRGPRLARAFLVPPRLASAVAWSPGARVRPAGRAPR